MFPVHRLAGSERATAVAWLPDDNGVLASVQDVRHAVLYDMARLEAAVRVRLPWDLPLGGPLAFCRHAGSGDALLAVAGPGGSIALVDPRLRAVAIETGEAAVRGSPSRISALAMAPDGFEVLAGTADGALAVWDLRTAAQRFLPSRGTVAPGRAAVRHVIPWAADQAVAVSADGFASLLDTRGPAGDCVVWRTEMPCETDAGYAAADVDGMLALPVGDALLFVDGASGDLLGRRALSSGASADAALYDATREALLLLDAESERIYVQRPFSV